MKKLMCAVMAAVIAVTNIVMTVPAAAEGKQFGDFDYKIVGSSAWITKYTGDDSYVIVPDEIDGRPVKVIDKYAFSKTTIEYISLPNRLEYILDNAFEYCEYLNEVVLPNSVKYVGGTLTSDYYYYNDKGFGRNGRSFAGCKNLSEFVMGDNVIDLGYGTFSGDSELPVLSLSPSILKVIMSYYLEGFASWSYTATSYSETYIRTDKATTDLSVTGDKSVGILHFPSKEVYDSAQKYKTEELEYDIIPLSDSHAKVSFNTNGGDTKNSELWTLRGQSVSEEVPPEKKDCEFVGWYTNPEGKGEPWDFVFDKVSDDMTLYAKWRPLQFSVTFDAQGGSCSVKQQDYSFGLEMGSLPVPTRTNYKFIGWYTRADGNGELYTTNTIMPRTDVKLYAAWLQDGKSLVVDFNANGGEIDSEKALVPYNATITSFPKAKRTGYSFVEWNNKADGTGDTYNKSKKVIYNNLTLYAIWKVNSYTVTLDANMGTVSQDKISVLFDSAIGELPMPKRDGYEFNGWYYSDGTKVNTSDKMPSKNITLKAKWTGFEYMILFDAKKGTMPAEDTMFVSCGEEIGKMPVPTRKGYEFMGWYTKPNSKGKQYTEKSEMPEKDLTLYAGWKKITQYASAVKFDSKSLTLGVGQTSALNAVTTPVLTLDKLKWSSTNSKVASVNDKGVVTAKSVGTATIKVTTSKGKTASIKVTVKKAVTKISLSYSARTIKVGQTVKAVATPTGYAGALKWSSSNPAVAKVDQDGNITGIKAGKAVITIKAYNGVTAKITITVK